MVNIQPTNEVSDMLVAHNYTPLNEYEKAIVRDGVKTPNPRAFIAQLWLCPYHPEIVRALSLSHGELLRLIGRDVQIPLPASSHPSFEIIW